MDDQATEDGHNTPATSVHAALQMAEHKHFIDTRYLIIHGFKTGMKQDTVLQEAHHIANVLGHQIDDAQLQEAMDNSHPWQIDIYDGQFGICVTLTHAASFVTNYSHHRDWLTLPTYTCRLGEVQEDGNARRYHVQASIHPPQFYMTGLREMVVIRGAPNKEEYVRHWLQGVYEFLNHQLPFPFALIVRTANNKTSPYAVQGRRTTQWLVETVLTLSCPAGLYSEVDARTANVRKIFKLSGANKFSHPFTIQGLHYEVISSSNNLKVTAPLDPDVRIFKAEQTIHEITGISRESTPHEVIKVLIETGHLDPEGLLNYIWTPGAEFPVPGYKNDRFRSYPSSLTLIGTPKAVLIMQDPRWGCQGLLSISPPSRDKPFALKFTPVNEHKSISIMRDIHTAAHKSRFPGGSHIHPTAAAIRPRTDTAGSAWTSTTDSSLTTNTTTDTQLERLNTHDTAIQTLNRMFTSFNQRVSNLEVGTADQSIRIGQLHTTVQAQERDLNDIKSMVKDNTKSAATMDTKLDMILRAMTAAQPNAANADREEKC